MGAPLTLDVLLAMFAKFGITLAAVVIATWLLFRYLGDKWLSGKFDERLEAFKSAQQQEIERLKLRINTAFDWTVKLQGREFEVLAEIWGKLADTFKAILALISSNQSHPNLDRMNTQELEHFLSLQDIPDYQKDDIRNASQKLEVYIGMRFWQSYNLVDQKRLDFDRYFLKNRMFVRQDIREKVKALSDMMWEALSEKKYEQQYPHSHPNPLEKCDKLQQEGPKFFDDIDRLIEVRVWKNAEL